MSTHNNESFLERRRTSIGQANLAYEEHPNDPINHEDIQMEKRTTNSDPPSYSSQASLDDSFNDNIVKNNKVETNYDLKKVQDMYNKSKLDDYKNITDINSIPPKISSNSQEYLEKKLNDDQFESVTFKGGSEKKK